MAKPSTRTPAPTAVAKAHQLVEEERATLARWEADQAAAAAELESLQDRAGAEVLDNPDAARQLPKVLAELRDRIEIAGKAIAAQGPRVTAAESAYLMAEADVLDRVADAARRERDQHEARTAELLALLAEHEGPFVPERELVTQQHVAGTPLSRQLDKSELLQLEVVNAERPVEILRAMAEGRDPQPLVTEWAGKQGGIDPATVYPACVWGPDAIVPAPLYLRRSSNTETPAPVAAAAE
jgi:hypothetical protein